MSENAAGTLGGLRGLGRAGATLAGGEIVTKLLVLARNAIVANLITRDDFGLATTFALTVSALELASDVGVRQFLVQREDGDSPTVQQAAHMWQLLRGLALGALLFMAAPFIAELFGAPQAVRDYRILAAVPALRGLAHLDVARFERSMRFRPGVIVGVSSEAVATVTAVAFALTLGDERAILFGLLAHVAATWLVSRLVAERPYGVTSDRETFRVLLTFGWPLLVNGLVIFAIMQGDRLLVGAFYSLSDLAGYSVAFGLAVMPALMLARVNGRILLPLLAGAQGNEGRFRLAYERSTEVLGFASSLLAAGFITVGPIALVLLYGEQYDDTAVLLAVLGGMQSMRLLRAAPSQAALARGETKNTMQANIARLVGLGVAAILALMEAPLVALAATGLVAESVALIVATLLLARSHGLPPSVTLVTAGRATIVPLVAAAAVLLMGDGVWERVGIGIVAALAVVPITTRAETRRWLRRQIAGERRTPDD